jgi:hypothetical protein
MEVVATVIAAGIISIATTIAADQDKSFNLPQPGFSSLESFLRRATAVKPGYNLVR